MNFICTAFSDVMFTGLLTKAWSMSSWKSFVFKITCHIKQTILCWMSALGQNYEKGVRDYCKFNSAWNASSKRRVRAEFCLGTDPCESEGFIEFMGGCKGTLPCGSLWRFFWCRNKSSRPSSSHQDDRRAGERERQTKRKRDQERSLAQWQITCWLNCNLAILSSDYYLAGAKLIAKY